MHKMIRRLLPLAALIALPAQAHERFDIHSPYAEYEGYQSQYRYEYRSESHYESERALPARPLSRKDGRARTRTHAGVQGEVLNGTLRLGGYSGGVGGYGGTIVVVGSAGGGGAASPGYTIGNGGMAPCVLANCGAAPGGSGFANPGGGLGLGAIH